MASSSNTASLLLSSCMLLVLYVIYTRYELDDTMLQLLLYLILCFLKEIKWDESVAKGQIVSDSIYMRMCANTLSP